MTEIDVIWYTWDFQTFFLCTSQLSGSYLDWLQWFTIASIAKLDALTRTNGAGKCLSLGLSVLVPLPFRKQGICTCQCKSRI